MYFPKFFFALDLGQTKDFTVIAVLERVEKTGPWDPAAYAFRKIAMLRLRYLERVPLGTPYPEIVDKLREMVRSYQVAGQCEMAVDATGVGQAVVDMFERVGLECRLWRVKITGGDREHFADRYHRVPKRDLIAGVQVLLRRHALEIARGIAEGETLVREMTNMQVRIMPSGYEQMGVWREGEHDDMVLALSLACWLAAKVSVVRRPARESSHLSKKRTAA